jgi:hypothetical protein
MRLKDDVRRVASIERSARSRERVFQFPRNGGRRGLIPTLFLAMALLWLPIGNLSAQSDGDHDSAARAVEWLVGQQLDDGGFPGFTGEPDAGTTTDAVIALAAARAAGIEVDLSSAIAFLEEEALVYAQQGPGSAAKLTLAITAAGRDPHNFNAVDPLAIVSKQANQGLIGGGIYDHALGILALAGSGEAVPDAAIEVLPPAQNEDGSWAFDGSLGENAGDSNTTALVVQALVAAGEGESEMVSRGVEYLAGLQTEEGGYPYQPEGPADANSTSLTVQALIAAGYDMTGAEVSGGLEALVAFQNKSGALRWLDDQPEDNLFATLQAIPALVGQPLPVPATVPIATPVATPEAA